MTKSQRFQTFIDHFSAQAPHPTTELIYHTPFELLVAVMLSAQCTDKRINQVTPALFKAFPTAKELASATAQEVFTYIRSVSYPNNKAKHLVAMAHKLVKDFRGEIPEQVAELTTLPGVGRKTAHVVAATLYNAPTLGVDTHVFRVSKRLGLVSAKATTPLAVERALTKHLPKPYIHKVNHWLVLHGRYTCKARKPLCRQCPLTHFCSYFQMSSQGK